ncbi:hypothetical protein P40081_28595 [Paenibacillus sp. FSL P4-0081]|uniref:hypothetical protein n=1 Tax=Paenibacillus sp. FSL P4-0081 TaxID=1536769 RepID=UPI0004F85A99|nr:hypothetical protein [Paenibacillus sp. FSL P4-0081]AIQ31652.1 hypothetical protein P40081_28595 [Paenibacillus sp. FSL P4-0081]
MLKAKRKYVRVCKQCGGAKEYILLQTFQGKEYATPVRCTYCDDNGNNYDNRKVNAQKKTP